MALTDIERGTFLALFNRNGVVLNFTTNDFDVFTYEHVGVALCQKYNYSKGRSLNAFLHDPDILEEKKDMLLFDLLEYYENVYLTDGKYSEYSREEEYKEKYFKCKKLRDAHKSSNSVATLNLIEMESDLSSEYIDSQIKLIFESCESNPTVAIGKSKELIESICKTILDRCKEEYDYNMKLNKLVKETMGVLGVLPENVDDNMKAAKNLKGILTNLAQIADHVAELRNYYGDGHGKTSDFSGLQPRHARLTIGAASTLIYFLWETYKLKKK